MSTLLLAAFRSSVCCAVLAAIVHAQDDPVAVFVLAGQSNMEGKAQNVLLEHQATDPATAALFAPLRKDGAWVVRDDVFVDYLGRRGGLTIGFGSPGRSGVELEFGTVLGERCREPVLLIKTAWGGRSLQRDFRSPSAGMPGDELLAAELAAARKRVAERNAKDGREDPLPTIDEIRAAYGKDYRAMLAEVRASLAEYGERFPALRGRTTELRGFVWFQGWNDQYGGAELEYEKNLRHFIADVRAELGVPELPFVIGVMGQNGSKPAQGAMKVIQDAQLAVADLPHVSAVRTDALVDREAEALYPSWKEKPEQWQRTGSDHPYHYLGSAIWMMRIGHAMADAMLAMRDELEASKRRTP